MTAKKIYVTDKDLARLLELLKTTIPASDSGKKDLKKLKQELDRAEIRESASIPPDVVTMNSKVQLTDLDSGKEYEWRLVYPKDENISQGRISILAPLGSALIGYREGDSFEWEVPSGLRKFRIGKVLFQPESAGFSNL